MPVPINTVLELKTVEQFEEAVGKVRKSDAPVRAIVDFWAKWCGPCRVIGPEFQSLAQCDKSGKVKFCQVDVDSAADVARAIGVSSMPTFIAYENGVEVGRVVGADPHKLRAMVSKLQS